MARITNAGVLTQRADFLRAARGRRCAMPAFILQAWNRGDGGPVRIGFTCSKKVGNAVARNRAKRRLREVARLALSTFGQTGYDYVLVGRAEQTARRNFDLMRQDFEQALRRVSK